MLLAADIGGTRARLALCEPGPGGPRIIFQQTLPVAEHSTFEAALAGFLAGAARTLAPLPPIAAACLGVAGPVLGGRVQITNSPWILDAGSVSECLGGSPVRLVNDFEAAAHGALRLAGSGLRLLQAGSPAPGNRLVIGPGTGLGVAYCIPAGEGAPGGAQWRVIAGEGGHMGFAPRDDDQAMLWRRLRQRFGRVSAEHVVSGAGIVRIHDALAAAAGRPELGEASESSSGPARVAELAGSDDPTARRAHDLFADSLGAVCGDHALAVLARGGVYVAGGIAPRLLAGPRLASFLSAFRDKGPFGTLVAEFPIHLVVDPATGLLGAASLAASEHSATVAGAAATDLAGTAATHLAGTAATGAATTDSGARGTATTDTAAPASHSGQAAAADPTGVPRSDRSPK